MRTAFNHVFLLLVLACARYSIQWYLARVFGIVVHARHNSSVNLSIQLIIINRLLSSASVRIVSVCEAACLTRIEMERMINVMGCERAPNYGTQGLGQHPHESDKWN